MRLPRMTTRLWMVAVAVIGTLLWGSMMAQERSRRCQAAIRFHFRAAQFEVLSAGSLPAAGDGLRCGSAWEYEMSPEGIRHRQEFNAGWRAYCLRRAVYHIHAKEKFERAEWRVWEALPNVPSDPPVP
jgi:hypothetical protein